MSAALRIDGNPLPCPPGFETWAMTLARRGLDPVTIRDTMREWSEAAAEKAILWAAEYDRKEAAE